MAPERDTPGISATHCASPMITASFRFTCFSSRRWVASRSASTITALHRISAPATTQRLRSGPTMMCLPNTPSRPIGTEPAITYQPNR